MEIGQSNFSLEGMCHRTRLRYRLSAHTATALCASMPVLWGTGTHSHMQGISQVKTAGPTQRLHASVRNLQNAMWHEHAATGIVQSGHVKQVLLLIRAGWGC